MLTSVGTIYVGGGANDGQTIPLWCHWAECGVHLRLRSDSLRAPPLLSKIASSRTMTTNEESQGIPPTPSPRDGSSVGRSQRLGEADQTHTGYLRAIKLFDAYQKNRDEPPLEELDEEYFEADNLENELGLYLHWLASTNIPKYFDRSPTSQDGSPTTYLVTSTKIIYAGKLKEALKHRFPSHPSLQRDAEGWWTALSRDFKKAANRQQNMMAQEEFGERKKYPLYRDLRDSGDMLAVNPSQPDLRSVLLSLMENYDRFETKGVMEQCAQIVMTSCAIGRGGECKFNNYKDWTFDPKFQVTDVWWREMKTVNNYSMPMGPNKDDWVTDFYHAMGRYWCLEKGLLRTDGNVSAGSYVFPRLHCMRDNSVTSQMTGFIRKNLPEGMSSRERSMYSCKSMRMAAQTEMAANPAVGFYESHARSGHSLGTSQESYIDRSCMALSLRAMRSLCGWKENNVVKRLPRLEALGGHNQSEAERFLEEMFPHTMPEFFCRSGTLRQTYRAVGASMIMYHTVIRAEHGAKNNVYEFLRDLAIKVELRDQAPGNDWDPEMVLSEWSKIIKRDFDESNREVGLLGDGPTADRVVSVLNRMSDGVVEHGRNMSRIVSQNEEFRVLNESLTERVVTLTNRLQEQADMLDTLRLKLHCFKTPERVVSRQRENATQANASSSAQPRRLLMQEDASLQRQPRDAVSTEDVTETVHESRLASEVVEGQQGTGGSRTSQKKRKRQTNVQRALRHGVEAERISQKPKEGVKGSKITVEDLVMYYHEKKKFTNNKDFNFGNFEPPPFITDSSLKSKCRKALLLMERNTNDIVKEDLARPNLLPSRLKECCHAISKACMNDLETLEGSGESSQSNRKVPTIGALGNRVGKFISKDNTLDSLPERPKDPVQRIDKHFVSLGRGPRNPRPGEREPNDRLSVTGENLQQTNCPRETVEHNPTRLVDPNQSQEAMVINQGGAEMGAGNQQSSQSKSDQGGKVATDVPSNVGRVRSETQESEWTEDGENVVLAQLAARYDGRYLPDVIDEVHKTYNVRSLTAEMREEELNQEELNREALSSDSDSDSEKGVSRRGGTVVRRRRNRFVRLGALEPTARSNDTQGTETTDVLVRRVLRNNGVPTQDYRPLDRVRTPAEILHALESTQENEFE